MRNVGDFLFRFKHLAPPDDAIRRAVAEAVSSIAGVRVRKTAVTISRGTAFVKCSSVAKSNIRVLKVEILREIARKVPIARDLVRDVR